MQQQQISEDLYRSSPSIRPKAEQKPSSLRGVRPLQWLNFFMADMQGGIGPFLGVFLQAHGWATGTIGSVLTIGSVTGMAVTIPAGAFTDHTVHKRLVIILAGICAVLASVLIWVSQEFWLVAGAQMVTAIAGSVIGPAVTGITLGLVRQKGFNKQNGRNQAYNHAGNLIGAALSGYLGWRYGFTAVFALVALFGVLSIVTTLLIPKAAIDHRAARGMASRGDGEPGEDQAAGFHTLFKHKPLLILSLALAMFHLGNAAMLPLYGMAAVAAKQGNPAGLTAQTIMVAQGVMIIVSILGAKIAEKRGYWLVILIGFLALPLRGVIAFFYISEWGLYPVQILDGIGGGLLAVAVPGLIACMLDGSGHINLGQGAVMTIQGIGGAISPLIGGWIAQLYGFDRAFLILGSFALVSVGLWTGFAATLRPVCGGRKHLAGGALAPA